MTNNHELPTARLDQEPAILKGCSLSELTAMTVASAVVLLPVSLTIASMFGATVMGFGVSGVLLVISVMTEASIFQRIKARRPMGFYQQVAHLWLAKRHLKQSPLVTRSGVWDLGRT